MLRRLRKQLTIVGILVAFVVSIIGLVILAVYKPPPPPPPPPPSYGLLRVLSTGFVQTIPDRVDLYAFVRNPNANAGVRRVPYTFIVRAGDRIVARVPGETFFLPGQEKPVVAIFVSVQEPVTGVAIEFGSPEWVAVGPDFRAPSLIKVGQQELTRGGPNATYVVKGILANESSLDYLIVEVTAVGLNDAEQIIGVSKTFAGSLLARERREFTVSWPLPAGEVVRKVRVFPEVNSFSPRAVQPPKVAPGVSVP